MHAQAPPHAGTHTEVTHFELILPPHCHTVVNGIKRGKELCKVCSIPSFVCSCLFSAE